MTIRRRRRVVITGADRCVYPPTNSPF